MTMGTGERNHRSFIVEGKNKKVIRSLSLNK